MTPYIKTLDGYFCFLVFTDGLLLLGSESGIGFIERPVDGWSANNSSTFVVQSLNLTSEGWAKHLAGQFANDVLLWFHPGDTGLILYTTGRVRAKNFSSPILHFDDRCSGQVRFMRQHTTTHLFTEYIYLFVNIFPYKMARENEKYI